jgi:hypothetical protein
MCRLELAGRPMKIVRALYGLKSSGACWRNDMAETLRKAQFVSCVADPDVWMRPAVKINGDNTMNTYSCMLMMSWHCLKHRN